MPRYIFAAFCTMTATVLALELHTYFAHGVFSLYLLAVVASALFGGLGPGIFATIFGVLLADYFLLAPIHSLAVQSADDVAEIAVFSLVSVVISVLQTAQKKARAELRQLNSRLEDRVREKTAWMSLVYDITGVANETETVDQAFRFALKRMTTSQLWQYCQVYAPLPGEPDVLAPTISQAVSNAPEFLKLQDAAPAVRVRRGEGPVGRVLVSGGVEWIAAAGAEPFYRDARYADAGLRSVVVFPVLAERKAVAVVECCSVALRERDPQLAELMGAVGLELGQIVERKQLQEGYSEAVWQQQRRTAQDLHDGLGQRLTGLWMIGTSLKDRLQNGPDAALGRKLADGLEEALQEIRSLAKGVFPVDLDSEGLMAALKDLVAAAGAASGVACRFDCPDPVVVQDRRNALHLYRIAQESITNAIKHGKPGRVTVSLRPVEEGIELRVEDDGSGIAPPDTRNDGAGLRIMRYRAAAMDAKLKIEPNAGRGTLVTCLSPRGSRD